MKRYILIAGVNGAGKSTLYHILDELQNMPRINIDEIVNEFGRWDNPNDVMQAGKIALKRMKEYFDEEWSFNQETTLCGKSIRKSIKKAKEKGYSVEIHYVGVDSVDIAKARVQYRVSKGGHGIPVEDIERRYQESFRNLVELREEFDRITFYDNTTYFERIAIFENNKMELMPGNIPKWFEKIK